MTTTAFDDQFVTAPEPVRQPYDTVAILRRNVADLELALRTLSGLIRFRRRTTVAESREEAKIRLRGFVEEYVALCNKYEAEVIVNSYGVHCVETDAGLSFPFKSVYPEWDMVEDDRNEWDRNEEEES